MSRENSGIVCKIIDGKYKDRIAIAYHRKQMQVYTNAGKAIVTVFKDADSFQAIAENVIISVNKLIKIGFSD